MTPNQQDIKVKLPATLFINQQGERYQLLLNDETFNFYKNETLKIEANKKYLTVGLK